jgi:hypothetical protein
MAADTLKLTDEEAAVIAVLADGAWRTPLLTINEASKAELAASVLRGRRSLVVRDLADADGTPTGLAAEVLKRLGTGLCAMFMLVDESDAWLPGAFNSYLYGASVAEIEMTQVVGAMGVHHFRVAPPPGPWHALTGLAGAIYASGFPAGQDNSGGRSPASALLHVVRPGGLRSIRIARGTVTTGRGPVPARFPSVPDAVSWLLA